MQPFVRLLVPRAVLDAVIAHAQAELPNECCGLLAGTIENCDGRAVRHFPIRNDLASTTEYFTNARDLLDAMKDMRTEGLEVLAIYHSHPASEPIPSKTDLARNSWGESALHLIVGFSGDDPGVRAWWLAENEFREAEWKTETASTSG